MNKWKRTILNKRLPLVLGVLFLVLSLSTISWLTSNVVIFGTRATFGSAPSNIRVSNITDDSFTVSYLTDIRAAGTVAYGSDQSLGSVALDDRDKQHGTSADYRVHSITINQLQPATRYYFTITSGTQRVDDNGIPFEVVTAPTLIETPLDRPPVQGKIALEDGSIPTEALAYFFSDISQLRSAIVQPDGSYSIPLAGLRTKDLSALFPMTTESTFTLLITNGSLESKTDILASDVISVPLIVLSNNYDFTFANSPTPIQSGETDRGIFPTTPDSLSRVTAAGPLIVEPEEGAELKDQKPTIKGKAFPNKDIELTIQNEKELTVTIQSDEDGNWEYRPEQPLSPGEQTVTIVTTDLSGASTTLSQTFTIFASGSEFVEPSIEPTEEPTKAPTPTEVPVQPTPTPTQFLTPSPTAAPASPSASVIMTKPNVPEAGTDTTVFGMVITTLIIGSGALLFFLTGGMLP